MISIIMNSYKDNQNYLKQAIESWYKNKDVEIDLIISTVKNDSAIDMAKEFGIKKIVINNEPGIFQQLNTALNLVEGEWFCLSSGNDYVMPNKLIVEKTCALKNKKKICYSAYYVTDERLDIKHINKFHEYNYKKHLEGNFVYDVALMHRSIFDKYMPYQTKWGNHACWDFWLRVYEGEGNIFAYNPIPVWGYRQTKDSQHIRRKRNEKWKQENIRDRDIMLNYHKNLYK